MGENYYQKRDSLLTEHEKQMHEVIRQTFPDYIINTQVALSQIVEAKANGNWQTNFNKISRLVLDFVILNTAHQVIACIELDDWTHKLPRRQDADERKEKALQDAGIMLLRFNTIPSPEGLLEKFEQAKKEKLERLIKHNAASELPEPPKVNWENFAPQGQGSGDLIFFGLTMAGLMGLVFLSMPEVEKIKTHPKQEQPQQENQNYDSAPNDKWIRLRPGLFINPLMSQKDGSYSIAFIRNNGQIQKVLLDCTAQGILNNGRWKYQNDLGVIESQVVRLGCL